MANISKKLKFILFADDTNVFCSGENMNDVIQMLNDELRNMSVWFKVNKLSLNVSKTNYMVFSNKWKHSYNTNEIKIDDILIEEVTVTKFLGVLIDNKLQWKEQIDSVCSKVSKNMSIIYRVRHILDTNSLFTLYCTLILPYLNYASEIWGNTYVSRLNRLSVLQKRSLRLIENYKPRESSNPLFYKYKCLKFSDLIEFKTLIIIFKAKYTMLPEILRNYSNCVKILIIIILGIVLRVILK